jgi:TRAP-type C4-dicarboxylate transport system substrate-binding protein
VAAGPVRQGAGQGLPLPGHLGGGLPQHDHRDPLNSPADAKGKKLRTFPNEMMRWTLEAMGFNIQIMPLPEVYLAIQQGAVAGQENPIDTIYSNKFYEVAPTSR